MSDDHASSVIEKNIIKIFILDKDYSTIRLAGNFLGDGTLLMYNNLVKLDNGSNSNEISLYGYMGNGSDVS